MKITAPPVLHKTAFHAARGDLLIVHTVELQECVCITNLPSDPKGSIRTLVTVLSCRVQQGEPGYQPAGIFMTVHPDVPVTLLEQVDALPLRERNALDEDKTRAARMAVLGAQPTTEAARVADFIATTKAGPLPTTP